MKQEDKEVKVLEYYVLLGSGGQWIYRIETLESAIESARKLYKDNFYHLKRLGLSVVVETETGDQVYKIKA